MDGEKIKRSINEEREDSSDKIEEKTANIKIMRRKKERKKERKREKFKKERIYDKSRKVLF